MKRSEVLKNLERIEEMSAKEMTLNAAWIREVANKAHMHINVLRNDRKKRD